jgi:hypothetical protein
VADPTPEILFVCSAKIDGSFGAQLKGAYGQGAELAGDTGELYRRHLIYSCAAAERGLFLEAGPSAEFDEMLWMICTDSPAKARLIIQADPLYTAGVIKDDDYFEWHIHAPLWRCALPPMPEQTIEVRVKVTTPQHLFAAFGTFNPGMIGPPAAGQGERPLFEVMHILNMNGAGGMATMGYVWAAGPDPAFTRALHVLNAASIDAARFVNESDALYRWGLISDFRYFEWCIHFPIAKASPQHKRTLLAFLEQVDDQGVEGWPKCRI